MSNSEDIKQHEELFVDMFIAKEQRQRIKTLIKSKKGRIKLRGMLSHSLRFDSSSIHKIPNDKQTTSYILEKLNSLQANSNCYLLSEHTSYDGKVMKLEDALNEIVGSGITTIISCIPGKLAYFEGEEINDRFILKSH